MLTELKEFLTNGNILKELNEPVDLDAIELTSILKSYGYHLDSFDYVLAKSDRNAAQDIQIDIRCNKSGIVSKMSYKGACSCPDEEAGFNNSYWEVQGSAPSSNEVHDASSNLLPQLSPRVVQFSRNLIKLIIMAQDYKTQSVNVWSTTANGTKADTTASNILLSPNIVNKNDTICTTPVNNNNNNNNGSPTRAEDFVASVLGVPQIILATADSPQVCDQTQPASSTFASPNSDVFTSSPNGNPDQFKMLTMSERDLVVMNLRQIRSNIDATLTNLDFNSTRDITDSSILTPRQTATPLTPAVSNEQLRRHSISIPSSMSRRSTGPSLPIARVGSLRRPLISAAVDSKRNPPLPTLRTPSLIKKPEPHIDTPMPNSATRSTNAATGLNRTPKPIPSRSATTLNPPSRERLTSLSKLSAIATKVSTAKPTQATKEITPAARVLTKTSSMSRLTSTSSKTAAVKPSTSNGKM